MIAGESGMRLFAYSWHDYLINFEGLELSKSDRICTFIKSIGAHVRLSYLQEKILEPIWIHFGSSGLVQFLLWGNTVVHMR